MIEQFIQLFSEKKPVIERHLKHLHEIADGLDEVNRNSAIAKTTGSCVSAAGGVMTIAGFALAPFTFGASTLLAGVGLGIGLLGGATTVGTEITKAVIDGGENKKVAQILEDVESAMSELDKSVGKACQTVSKWDETGFENILKATGQLGAKGASAASALSRVVRVSLSKGARIAGGVVAGVFVALDVYEIAKNSIDIHKGCKSERAKEIRKLVETTESDLAELEDVCSDMKKLSTEAEDLSSEMIEQFIQLFSEKKPVIERHLKHLHEIADGLDEVNRNSAIAKTTGSCVSAAGGVMTIAGFALAPFTFGASTLLAGVGLGVGLLGGATTVGTEITKAVIDGGENKKVAEILEDVESAMSELDKSVGKACQTVSKWDETGFEHILKATGQLGAKGASAASALSRVVRVSLSKGARIAGGVVAGVFVALDVYEIAKNSIDIHKGCKSERAKEIRKLVETTESDLAELEDVCSDMKKLSSTVELDPEKKRTMEKETSELPAIAEAAFPVRITAKAGAALGLSALAALAILSTEDPIAVGAIVLMLLLLVLLLCLTVQLSRQIQ
ncbi:UNVERIFIED_CONTAM: hypothetical protein FKN15_061217 [Acipenser sinensis]